MTYKVFTDNKGNELSIWLNDQNRIHIEIRDMDNPLICQFIEIDKDDASELVDELQELIDNLD